jgi:hypothetical protein
MSRLRERVITGYQIIVENQSANFLVLLQEIEMMSQQDKHLTAKMLEAEARVRTHRDEENQVGLQNFRRSSQTQRPALSYVYLKSLRAFKNQRKSLNSKVTEQMQMV